ncbi:MAG TPA: PA14 domain-containing protein, partial [Bacteroidia bacterium]|nr:PA14 domain-containing protein [Bacteroidia bacterium]
MKRFSVPLALALLVLGTTHAQDDPLLAQGRTVYQSCVACHGPDGKGVKAGDLLMAPSLHESGFVKGDHPELLAAIVLKGIHKADNRYVQAMLALEAVLDDRQIAALVAYVTQEFGEKRRAFTPEESASVRKEHAPRTSPWKRQELEERLAEASAPPLLTNLRYAVHHGEWKKLPDFPSMPPAATGTLPKGLLSLEPASGHKHGFGMVFDADLSIPETGDYYFSLTSDDGSALIIDGETVVGNDGIHPAKTASMKETLQAGHHSLQVRYFDGGGQRTLALFVKGPGKFGTRWLSVERDAAQKAAQSLEPILLSARNPGEAVMHRAFLPDAKPRAIGVGYPGAVNLVWDADVLNLAYVYRGEFMDAATHWNNRGSGSTPLGQDRVKTAHGLPFQILESSDEPWQAFSETSVKYERDTEDPQKEITLVVRHPDYRFRGYRLDAKRFPTFRYDYRKLSVTDTFAPAGIDGVTSLVRTVRIEGEPDKHTFFRVAETGLQTLAEGWLDVGGGLKVKIEGAEPIQRQSGGKTETLVPVAAATTLTLT